MNFRPSRPEAPVMTGPPHSCGARTYPVGMVILIDGPLQGIKCSLWQCTQCRVLIAQYRGDVQWETPCGVTQPTSKSGEPTRG